MSAKSISIVMPIYNEEALLDELFSRVTRVLDSVERELCAFVRMGTHQRWFA